MRAVRPFLFALLFVVTGSVGMPGIMVMHMVVREISERVSSVGAVDWDRRLFDALIPLPQGTSYNAYLIKGSEKTALIDTVDATKEEELIRNLLLQRVDRIDYVVVNHAEQDHSGTLPMVLELYPDAQVLCSTKGKELIASLLQIPAERCRIVDDGETVSLGDRSLQFFITPWVHWPDTMLTYMPEEKILFPCDFLGAHLASGDLYATDEITVYASAKRYYAEIMMPFRTSVVSHLEKIKDLDIAMIAPSHGPVHKRPSFILDAYREWSADTVKNEAVIAYVSMHGSTEAMAEYLASALMKRGVGVQIFNLTVTDIGELAKALVDPATLVLGTPTMLFGPHPLAAYAAFLTNALHPKVRAIAIFGSFGWGGTTVQQLTGALNHLKVDLHDPVFVRGAPGEKDFRSLDALAQAIYEKHRSYGIVAEAP